MVSTQQSKDMVMESLAALNEEKADDEKIPISGETVLMGDGANLDSLDLINLIIDLEDRLYAATEQHVQLSVDNESFEDDHPFRTASALIDHINGFLQPRSNGD